MTASDNIRFVKSFERDEFLKSQCQALRRDVQAGLAQLDRGESVTPTARQIMDNVDQRLKRER